MADDKRKKRGRSKVFRSCFRSVDADKAHKSDGLDSINGRLGIPENGRTGKELVNDGVADDGGDCFVKRPRRRRFSRIIKAVLFDSMMTKKIRRNSSKSSIDSDTSVSTSSSDKTGKSSDDNNASGKEFTDVDDSCSHSNLFSSSSRTTLSSASTSSSSSMNSNSRWPSDQKHLSQSDSVDITQPIPSNPPNSKKPNPRSCFDQKTSSGTDSLNRQDSSISLPSTRQKPINSIPKSSSYQKGLSRLDSRTSVSSNPDKVKSVGINVSIHWCLFLLFSLVVLVIWGRIFAILCTSISFYFIPRRLKRVNSVNNSAEFLDFDSDQYKKKVIMAGLLERTRNPIR